MDLDPKSEISIGRILVPISALQCGLLPNRHSGDPGDVSKASRFTKALIVSVSKLVLVERIWTLPKGKAGRFTYLANCEGISLR